MYRAVSNAPAPPPLQLQVLLSVPDLTNNQVLVHLAPDSSRLRVDPTPRHIVLENWLLNFTPSSPEVPGDSDADSVAPSTIYKHGIPLFRSIYSLLRILPSWKLYKKLRRRTSNAYRNGNLSIHLRVKGLDDGVSATDILDFGKSRYHPFLVASFHLIHSFNHFISVTCRQPSRSQRYPSTTRNPSLPCYSAPDGHTNAFDRLPLFSKLPARRTRVPPLLPFPLSG